MITAPSELRFYQRLPPFKRTFEATCFPIFATWVAEAITLGASALVAKLVGLQLPTDGDGAPKFTGDAAWKGFVVFLVALFFELAVVVPAKVLLVRVQASLLGPDEQVILPFDRSFGGKLEPAIVGGKGFITLRDALTSFPRSSWVRLYKLSAKLVAVVIGAYVLMAAVIVPEVFLLMAMSKKA